MLLIYTPYYDQAKFKEALALAIEQERRFGGQQVRGIHVLGTYSSKVEVVEDRAVVR